MRPTSIAIAAKPENTANPRTNRTIACPDWRCAPCQARERRIVSSSEKIYTGLRRIRASKITGQVEWATSIHLRRANCDTPARNLAVLLGARQLVEGCL